MRLISIILAMWGFSGCGVLNPKDDGKSGGQPPTVNYRDGQYADFGLDTDDSISQRYTVNGQERLNIKLLRIFKNQHIRGDLNFVIAAKEGVNLFASGDVANGTSASLVLNKSFSIKHLL